MCSKNWLAKVGKPDRHCLDCPGSRGWTNVCEDEPKSFRKFVACDVLSNQATGAALYVCCCRSSVGSPLKLAGAVPSLWSPQR